jgi:hypothetical protein
MQPGDEENSEAVYTYKQFMKQPTANRVMPELKSEDLRRHRIIRVPERRQSRLAVYLLNISENGRMAQYQVRASEFCVYVKMLNL